VLRRGTIAALGVVSAAAVASTAIVLGSSSGGSIDVIVGGTPTAAQTANCFPDPSACGYPDLDGTTPVGVQAGHTLTPVAGDPGLLLRRDAARLERRRALRRHAVRRRVEHQPDAQHGPEPVL
jgi:hypothetical protein